MWWDWIFLVKSLCTSAMIWDVFVLYVTSVETWPYGHGKSTKWGVLLEQWSQERKSWKRHPQMQTNQQPHFTLPSLFLSLSVAEKPKDTFLLSFSFLSFPGRWAGESFERTSEEIAAMNEASHLTRDASMYSLLLPLLFPSCFS